MHNPNISDVTIICFLFFGRKNTAHEQKGSTDSSVHLHASLPTNFSVAYSYAQTIPSILCPEFQACDTLPQVFWSALIPESKIY